MCFHFCRRRKVRLQTGDDRVHTLQRQNHVGFPVEVQIDLGGATAGHRSNFLEARNAVDSFLDWTRDGDEHLVDGHDAVVDPDDDAREIGVGENGHWDRKGKIAAHQRQADNQE